MIKKNFLLFLMFLIVMTPGVSAEFAQISFCDLEVKIDIFSGRYDVSATVDFITDEHPTYIFLHMENKISQITANGKNVNWYTIGSRLIIQPSKATLLKDNLHRIQIKYHGYAKNDPLSYFVIKPEYISLRPAIMWLPVYPDLVQVSLNYRMKLSLPQEFVLVSDGIPTKKWNKEMLTYYEITGSGKEPILVAAPFTHSQEVLSDLTIKYFYLDSNPENESKIKNIINSAQEALKYYERYSLDFPAVLNILLFPNDSANAEPNMIFFPENFDFNSRPSEIDMTIYHEMFHLIVPTCVAVEEPWLSEGIAHYMGFKALAHKYGIYSNTFSDTVYSLLQQNHYWHKEAWLVPLSDPRYLEKIFGEYSPYLLHDRPAISLFTLDYAIGEEKIAEFWTGFFQKYWGQKINLDTFKLELEDFTGMDLNWFFEDWFDGVVRPDYKISDVSINLLNDKYELKVILNNTGTGRAIVPVMAFGKRREFLTMEKVSLIQSKQAEVTLITRKPVAYLEVDSAKLLLQINMENDVFKIQQTHDSK